jgi:hypothetical protein
MQMGLRVTRRGQFQSLATRVCFFKKHKKFKVLPGTVLFHDSKETSCASKKEKKRED